MYGTNAENIYAILEATEENDEYIVLGAHYDTVPNCPGADDNASGIALVMAVALSMKGKVNRSRNFIFVLFDQEEIGLIGSNAFAQKLINDDFNIHSMHNFDTLGWDGDGDRAVELGYPYSGAVELYRAAADSTGLDIPIQPTDDLLGDHRPFIEKGLRAVGIFEEWVNGDRTPYIHQPTDTYETVDFDYLLSTTLLAIEAMKLLIK